MSEVVEPKTYEEKRQELLKLWEKQRIQAKSAKWYQEHKEEKREYCKEYREEHKEKVREREKRYYEQNEAKILEKAATKVICDACGSTVCRRRMTDHKRTTQCKAIQDRHALETHMSLLSGLGVPDF